MQVTPDGAGVARYVRELLASLKDVLRSEERVTAFVQHGALAVLPPPSDRLRYQVFGDSPTWRRILTQQFMLPSITRRFDVAHYPDYLTPLWWRGTAYVSTIHDMAYSAPDHFFTSSQSILRRVANPLTIRRATRVMVDSAFTRSEVLRLFPDVPHSRVSVVYPGIPSLPAPKDSHEVVRRLGLPARFVLSVGTLEPRKNLYSLLNAFARPELEEEYVVLVGRQGWGPSIQQSLGLHRTLASRVLIVGHISDIELGALYAEAAAFAYVSLYEGFGFPVLEALAAGLPTVASDIPVLRETTRGAAVFVDPRSPENIAAGIRSVLDQPAIRQHLSKSGAGVAKSYSWRSCAEEVLAVYRDLSQSRQLERQRV